MSRIFRRGELKEAVVLVLASIGEAHGYSIMTELKARIGGGWKPSPGAVYPAILALEEMGYVESSEKEGSRVYRLTESGEKAAKNMSASSHLASLMARSETAEGKITIGSILDRYAASSKLRRKLAGADQKKVIENILERADRDIEEALKKGDDDG